MPLGFVIPVLVVALCTALALRPISGPWLFRRLSFLLSIVPSELPQLVIAYLLLATGLAAMSGDLATPVGMATAAVAALAALGNVVLAARALQARRVVSQAVGEAVAVSPPRRGWRDTVRILLTPYPARPRAVVRVADVQYAPGGRRHRLDVYHRRDRPGNAPVLVYLHGGGYFSGGKHREGRLLLHRMAATGWVCLSANYRLRPRAGFVDHQVDARSVIAWAREHAREYGGDPDTVAIAGSSAGGHMAALAALNPNEPAFQPGFEDVDTSVVAAVGLYGYYGWYYDSSRDGPVPSSPLAHDATGAPPVFVAHGTLDAYVPVASARSLVRHLRGASAQPVAYAELPGAGHSFDLYRSLRFEAVVDGIEAFLGQVAQHRLQVPPSAPAAEEAHGGRWSRRG